MFNTDFIDSVSKTDLLPPMTLPRSTKKGDKWKRAVMDSFEHIGLKQLHENLSFFDNYRMVEGKITFQELSDVAPQLSKLDDLLANAEVPTTLRHYDITSIILNTIVDKYVDFQDKFHVTDSGEVAKNDFLRFKDEQIQEALNNLIKVYIDEALAKKGLDSKGKQFNSPEEQQQYMAQLEQEKQNLVPKDLQDSTKTGFKTIGVKWGEATLDYDKERFDLTKLGKENIKDFLISGRCFREYKIYHDKYAPRNWSPKNTFFSKEVEINEVQKGEFVGRIQPMTPGEVVKEYGHKISTDLQKELLGGNSMWMNNTASQYASGSIEQAVNSNFLNLETVPFKGYHDYNFMLGLQDELDMPMGIETRFNNDGTQTVRERYLPRLRNGNNGIHSTLAILLRSDFIHRKDLCQVTEVYFKAYDLWGYLTYEDESGRVVTEEVTEDILPDFLRDRGIKQTFKQSLHDIIVDFEVNTLKWQYKPVTYYGVKIQSANLAKAIYIDVEPMEHQIKGDSEYDVLLPVAGKVGESLISKILPYQASVNLCMNQIQALLEKELGMVLLLSTDLIPSEYEGWGSAEEALMAFRNTAKSVGLMPANYSMDSQKTMNNANPVQAINISHAQEISTRVQMADYFQKKAYELIGINPLVNQPTKYETAEGVKSNNEVNVAQISGIHEDFSKYNKAALELHLAVAQYCQSNKKDLSLYYTKSDASIQYLKMVDPDLPFRRLGLIATFDSAKRKELETFKSYLMQTNTLGADTMELAKLIASDAWTEVLDIVTRERENKERKQQQEYQQQQQMIQQQGQSQDQVNQKQWERQEESNNLDRQTKLAIAEMNASISKGGDDTEMINYDRLSKDKQFQLKEQQVNHQIEMRNSENELKKQKLTFEQEMALKKLQVEMDKIKNEAEKRRSSEYIASINKN
jgi:hypothetical protein